MTEREDTPVVWGIIEGVTDTGEVLWSLPLFEGKDLDEAEVVAQVAHGQPVKLLRREGELVLVETVLGQSGWVGAEYVREFGVLSLAELPIMALAVATVISPAFLLDLARASALVQEMGREALGSRLHSVWLRLQAAYQILVAPLAPDAGPEAAL